MLSRQRGPVGSPPNRLLDCTCGIGTQALPLAEIGYLVTGSDLADAAIARPTAQAEARQLPATFVTAEVRTLPPYIADEFDAVISCDNALLHLLTDPDLTRALSSIQACLRTGGTFLASIRDNDTLRVAQPTRVPMAMYGEPGARHTAVRAWRWTEDAEQIHINSFTLRETCTEGPLITTRETTYRALQRSTLTAAMKGAGFGSVRWLMPDESGYYQPIVNAVALLPSGRSSTSSLPDSTAGTAGVQLRRDAA